MERINKHTMLKQARENGKWKGFASGNKVNSGNVIHCWGLGMYVEITAKKYNDLWMYSVGETGQQSLEEFEGSMLYYMDGQLGNRVAYWNGNKSEMAVYLDEN